MIAELEVRLCGYALFPGGALHRKQGKFDSFDDFRFVFRLCRRRSPRPAQPGGGSRIPGGCTNGGCGGQHKFAACARTVSRSLWRLRFASSVDRYSTPPLGAQQRAASAVIDERLKDETMIGLIHQFRGVLHVDCESG